MADKKEYAALQRPVVQPSPDDVRDHLTSDTTASYSGFLHIYSTLPEHFRAWLENMDPGARAELIMLTEQRRPDLAVYKEKLARFVESVKGNPTVGNIDAQLYQLLGTNIAGETRNAFYRLLGIGSPEQLDPKAIISAEAQKLGWSGVNWLAQYAKQKLSLEDITSLFSGQNTAIKMTQVPAAGVPQLTGPTGPAGGF